MQSYYVCFSKFTFGYQYQKKTDWKDIQVEHPHTYIHAQTNNNGITSIYPPTLWPSFILVSCSFFFSLDGSNTVLHIPMNHDVQIVCDVCRVLTKCVYDLMTHSFHHSHITLRILYKSVNSSWLSSEKNLFL